MYSCIYIYVHVYVYMFISVCVYIYIYMYTSLSHYIRKRTLQIRTTLHIRKKPTCSTTP